MLCLWTRFAERSSPCLPPQSLFGFLAYRRVGSCPASRDIRLHRSAFATSEGFVPSTSSDELCWRLVLVACTFGFSGLRAVRRHGPFGPLYLRRPQYQRPCSFLPSSGRSSSATTEGGIPNIILSSFSLHLSSPTSLSLSPQLRRLPLCLLAEGRSRSTPPTPSTCRPRLRPPPLLPPLSSSGTAWRRSGVRRPGRGEGARRGGIGASAGEAEGSELWRGGGATCDGRVAAEARHTAAGPRRRRAQGTEGHQARHPLMLRCSWCEASRGAEAPMGAMPCGRASCRGTTTRCRAGRQSTASREPPGRRGGRWLAALWGGKESCFGPCQQVEREVAVLRGESGR